MTSFTSKEDVKLIFDELNGAAKVIEDLNVILKLDTSLSSLSASFIEVGRSVALISVLICHTRESRKKQAFDEYP
jgi:hypothetical protein